MAVVGKGFAVLQSGPIKMSGYLAWLGWAFIHLQFLALSSMRVSVFLQWIWTYFTGSRGSRLIVDHYASSSAKAAPSAQAEPHVSRTVTTITTSQDQVQLQPQNEHGNGSHIEATTTRP